MVEKRCLVDNDGSQYWERVLNIQHLQFLAIMYGLELLFILFLFLY
jgi:hypothetical protein